MMMSHIGCRSSLNRNAISGMCPTSKTYILGHKCITGSAKRDTDVWLILTTSRFEAINNLLRI